MIGINIGSMNTIYSSVEKDKNGNFESKVLLSDVSHRTIPSIISFNENQRIFGEIAKNSLKKNINSSFIDISRLIGIHPNSKFFQKEFNEFYYIGPKYNLKSNGFNINNKYNLTFNDIICSFLDKINMFFFKDLNIIKNKIFTISVPDYFTIYQKENLKLILSSLNIEKFNIINESTAITLDYGYMRYKDLFIINTNGKIGIDQNINKYVIFIDSGHSKTSFILSKFNYSEFKVLNVMNLPFLGGRNFDYKILSYVVDNFEKKNKIKIFSNNQEKNIKLKIRLLNEITKCRKILTVNKDVNISIDSFYNDLDLNENIDRDLFKKIIQNDLDEFEKNFKIFYKESRNLIDCDINFIEIAGDLMRTPILQKIVKDVSNKEINKGILIDECPSIGAALYNLYLNNQLPFKNFKNIFSFNNYNINYYENDNKKNEKILFKKGEFLPNIKSIFVDYDYYNKNKTFCLTFVLDKKSNENFTNNFNLFKIQINIKNIIDNNIKLFQNNKNLNIVIDFILENDNNLDIKNIYCYDKKKKMNVNIQYKNNFFTYINSEIIIKDNNILKNIINENKKKLDYFRQNDKNFIEYSNKKNDLESEYFKLKNESVENNNNNIKFIERLNSIEERIENVENQKNQRDRFARLDSIQNRINDLKNNFNK